MKAPSAAAPTAVALTVVFIVAIVLATAAVIWLPADAGWLAATPLAIMATAGVLIAAGALWLCAQTARALAAARRGDFDAVAVDALPVHEAIALRQGVRELRQDLENRAQFDALLANCADAGAFDWDPQTGRVTIDGPFKSLLGDRLDGFDGTGRFLLGRVHADDLGRFKAQVNGFLQSTRTETEIIVRLAPDDARPVVWLKLIMAAARDHRGTARRVVGLALNISERRQAEEHLLHNALRDRLTDLPNRTMFMRWLDDALAAVKRSTGHTMAILYLDVDRFKAVNDLLGETAGDDLLVQIGNRLGDGLGDESRLARIGSDQFAALVPDIATYDDAEDAASRVLDRLKSPMMLAGIEYFPSVTAGVALCSPGYSRAEDMLADASLAMTRAKSTEKGSVQVFRPDMRSTDEADRLAMETDLRRALERDELHLAYQPIVALGSKEVLVGFEALMRWTSPRRGPVSPGQFIPIAEETGLIGQMGSWALQEACRQVARWRARLPDDQSLYVSVNVSRRQLDDPTFADQVADALAANGLPPTALQLEITESMLMSRLGKASRTLDRCAKVGVGLAIDDFGTGYSSLSHLHRMPFTTLKIDRIFVKDIMTDPAARVIVKAVVDLAHALGLNVVAEGAELQGDVDALREAGCEAGQGFFFARPMPAASIEKHLLEWRLQSVSLSARKVEAAE